MRASDDDMCVVCQNDFNEDLDAVGHFINDVKHIFHRTCAEPWVNKHHDCLICRIPVESIDPTLFTRVSRNAYLRSAVGAAAVAGLVEVMVIGAGLIRPLHGDGFLQGVGVGAGIAAVWFSFTLLVLQMLRRLGEHNDIDVALGGIIAAGTTLVICLSMLPTFGGASRRQITETELKGLTSLFFVTYVLSAIAVRAYLRN